MSCAWWRLIIRMRTGRLWWSMSTMSMTILRSLIVQPMKPKLLKKTTECCPNAFYRFIISIHNILLNHHLILFLSFLLILCLWLLLFFNFSSFFLLFHFSSFLFFRLVRIDYYCFWQFAGSRGQSCHLHSWCQWFATCFFKHYLWSFHFWGGSSGYENHESK